MEKTNKFSLMLIIDSQSCQTKSSAKICGQVDFVEVKREVFLYQKVKPC